jgi:hypothetical protein
MKTTHSLIVSLLLTILGWASLNAQCPFDPTITGDTLLCPNGNGTLTTQAYDTYQWYQRPFGSTDEEAIPGATDSQLSVSSTNDLLVYFSVDATLNGCTERSPEVLLDGWIFLFPTVSTTGDFTIGNMGESLLCEGDTLFFNLQLPYNTNIIWTVDGNVIPGANSPTIAVTEPGTYGVSGAPDICPNYIQQLGVPLVVETQDCTTSTLKTRLDESLQVFPNPAQDFLHIKSPHSSLHQIKLFNTQGQLVRELQPNAREYTLTLGDFPAGSYWLEVVSGQEVVKRQILLL